MPKELMDLLELAPGDRVYMSLTPDRGSILLSASSHVSALLEAGYEATATDREAARE